MGRWEDISFIIRSENRKKIFETLLEPKTPTELAKELNLNLGYISNLLIGLIKRNLVECLTPKEKRHRFYRVSSKGKLLLQQQKKYFSLSV